MHDFGRLVYLDLQKTGSTFISKFLRECCTTESEIKFKKHGAIESNFKRNSIYFISIRHPISLYSSLYRYGLDKRGDVFSTLSESGFGHIYNSFEEFVAFFLNENNASHLYGGYNKDIASEIGFMSFRYMKLSLQYPLKKMKRQLIKEKNLSDLEGKFITSDFVKNENILEDLQKIVNNNPECFDVDKVKSFLLRNETVNASTTKDNTLLGLSAETKARLKEKEALLYKFYE